MTRQQLIDYVTEFVSARPQSFQCNEFALGGLEVCYPHLARAMRARAPKYDTLAEAADLFAAHDITDAAGYADLAIALSDGQLEYTDDPKPGDLCFFNTCMYNGSPLPAAGLVGYDGLCHFPRLRGGVGAEPVHKASAFLRVS